MNTPYDAEWLEADDDEREPLPTTYNTYEDATDPHQWPTEEEQLESFWKAVDGGAYDWVLLGLKTEFIPPGFHLEIVEPDGE